MPAADPPPAPPPEVLAAHLDAAAALQGLAIAPDWRPEVLANLMVLAAMAGFLGTFPLGDHAEPAPVFQA